MAGLTPTLDDVMAKAGELRASDIHLKVGAPPTFRVAGELVPGDYPKLSAEGLRALTDEMMTDVERRRLDKAGEVDFAFGRPATGRFRVNVYRQRGSVNAVLRAIGAGTFSFEELGLPHVMEELCRADRGLVVVTGGSGSGKSTTLAAMIDHINRTRRVSILTIEDPIEVLHPDKTGMVSQREVGLDTESFSAGLSTALRQDPDVVFVSEMRDRSTLDPVLHLARTGHLVLTSMHTVDAEETVERMISMYADEEVPRMRRTLALTLKATVSQRLLQRTDGNGLVPAVEVMVNTGRITEILRGTKGAPALRDVIVDGAYFGMQSFDQALLKLQQRGVVSFQDALAGATDPTDFKLAVQAIGLRSA